ncbi:MAG: aspartyl protease family protein [Candidatus Cybelea sp.]
MFFRVAALLFALASLFARAAAAQGYAPAAITVAQLFERNQQSVGSFEGGAYHVVTQTTSTQGDVWRAETYSDGVDYRTTLRIGDFVTSYGAYQGRRWHQDANGLVMPSSGVSAEVDPFIASLRSVRDPASGVKLLGMTMEPSPAFVVEVTPSNGLLERRYYDPHSYHLTRVERTDYDGHKQTWIYDDYRPVAGQTLAHEIEYQLDGTRVMQTKLVTYERVAAGSLDMTTPALRPLFDLGNRDAVVIPARFTDSGIIVTVSIEGRGLDFLLDSGSSQLLIDPEVARELGMKSIGAVRMSFAGDFTMADARAPDFSVGALTAKNVALSTVSFEEQLPDRRIVGLLGTDFIGSGALKIDFEKQTLTLFRSVPPDLAAQGWSPLPVRLDYSVPLVKAAYSNLPGYFVADLGADYSMLYPHYFSRFPNLVPRGAADQDQLETIGGRAFGVKHITMRSLTLGDWVFGGAQVVVPSALYAQDRDYDGLIGRDTLSSFNLIFDYANQRLWFKPIDAGSH